MREVTDIVAERIFNTTSGKNIRVIIGRPQQDLENKSYMCLYQVQGLGIGNVKEAWGVDSVQAILIAFQDAAALLHTSKEERLKQIEWVGSSERDMIGFPIADTLLDLIGMKLIDE